MPDLNAPILESTQILQTAIQDKDYGTIKQELTQKFELLKERASTHEKALDSYLKKTSTILKVIGFALSGGILYGLGLWLATLTLPLWAVASLDAAGILYGAFMTYHWLKTDMIPLTARLILTGGNLFIWADVIGKIFLELVTSHTLKTIHIGAIPFAITIEFLIRHLMQGVIDLRAEYEARRQLREREGGNEETNEHLII
jgi:hypothetical protein